MKVLLIDDWRELEADATARNHHAARKLLKEGGWDEVLMDYQLGMGQPNGLEIMEWAEHRGFLPDRVTIVSNHPDGVPKMRAWLKQTGFIEEEGSWRRLKEGEVRPKRKVTVHM